MISPSADYRNSQCPVASLLNPSRHCVTYVMAKVMIHNCAGQQRVLIADDLSCCLSRPDGGGGRRSGTRLIIGSRSLPSVAVPSSRSCLAADLRFRWNGAWCSGSAMLSAGPRRCSVLPGSAVNRRGGGLAEGRARLLVIFRVSMPEGSSRESCSCRYLPRSVL